MLKRLEFYIDENNWKPLNNHSYKQCELWFPLSSSVNDWKHDFHNLMLRDKLRMSKYIEAINILVDVLYKRIQTKINEKERNHQKISVEDKVVRIIDVGSGSGIWSYYIANRWKYVVSEEYLDSLKIYSIEINRTVYNDILVPNLKKYFSPTTVGKNSHLFQDNFKKYRILSINCSSTDLHSSLQEINQSYISEFDPELHNALKNNLSYNINIFDAIISECLGGLGDEEGYTEIIYPLINHFANDKCIVIPESIEQYFVPVSCDNLHQSYVNNNIKIISSLYDYENSEHKIQYFDTIIPKKYHIGQPKLLQRIIYKKGYLSPSNYKETITFNFSNSDINKEIVGIKGYFKATLINIPSKRIVLDISGDIIGKNTSDCWKHTYIPFENKWKIDTNEVEFMFSRELKDKLHYVYEWSFSKSSNLQLISSGVFLTQYFDSQNKYNYIEEEKQKKGNKGLQLYLLIEKIQLLLNNIFMGVIFTLGLFPGDIYKDSSHTNFLLLKKIGINLTTNWEIRIALLSLGFFMLRTNISLDILTRDYKFSHYIKNTFIFYRKNLLIFPLFLFSIGSVILFIAIPLIIATVKSYKSYYFFFGILTLLIILTLYDLTSKKILDINKNQDEKSDWTHNILSKAFKIWLKSDITILLILVIFFIYEFLSNDIFSVDNFINNSLLVTSLFFVIFNAIDYLKLNKDFYLEHKKSDT